MDVLALATLSVFGQADPIAGGAGWVGAGLLGLVLSWLLLKHLPDKDKQIKEFQEAKDQQIAELTGKHERKLELVTATFRTESLEIRREFKAALDAVLSHCEKEMGKFTSGIRDEIGRRQGYRGSGERHDDPKNPS